MASITLDELLKELRQRGFEGFSDGDLQRYLDWGFRKIVRLANWDWEQQMDVVTQQPGDYTLTIGDTSSDVPLLRDLMKIIDVTSGSSFILPPASEERWAEWLASDPSAALAVPDHYFFEWENTIYLIPGPNSQRTYNVYHWQYIGEVESAIQALPDDWEEMLLLSAECICHYRARQPEFAQQCEMRLALMVEEMLNEQNMKDPDFQERVDAPWSRVR